MENTTPTPPAAPKSSGWKVMSIISLCLGGISIIVAFIPCIGGLAIWSGIVATILSVISLVLASSAKAPKGMAIIALVVSVASIGVGYWRAKQLADAMTGVGDAFAHRADSAFKAMDDSLKKSK
jgi:hypothetical protein